MQMTRASTSRKNEVRVVLASSTDLADLQIPVLADVTVNASNNVAKFALGIVTISHLVQFDGAMSSRHAVTRSAIISR